MSNVQEWQQLANKELSRREKTVDSLVHQTAEGIAIKPLYLWNGNSTVVSFGVPRSWLTAASASQVQVILLPQPPK